MLPMLMPAKCCQSGSRDRQSGNQEGTWRTAIILILREPEAWHQGARDQQQHRGQAEGQV